MVRLSCTILHSHGGFRALVTILNEGHCVSDIGSPGVAELEIPEVHCGLFEGYVRQRLTVVKHRAATCPLHLAEGQFRSLVVRRCEGDDAVLGFQAASEGGIHGYVARNLVQGVLPGFFLGCDVRQRFVGLQQGHRIACRHRLRHSLGIVHVKATGV